MRKCKFRRVIYISHCSIYFIFPCSNTHTPPPIQDFFLFLKLNQRKQQNQPSSSSTHKFARTSPFVSVCQTGSPSCLNIYFFNSFQWQSSKRAVLSFLSNPPLQFIWSLYLIQFTLNRRGNCEFPRSTNCKNYWHKSVGICYEHDNVQLQNKARNRAKNAPNPSFRSRGWLQIILQAISLQVKAISHWAAKEHQSCKSPHKVLWFFFFLRIIIIHTCI